MCMVQAFAPSCNATKGAVRPEVDAGSKGPASWAPASKILAVSYISSPSDGAVLEAKTRVVPLPLRQHAATSCSGHQ